MREGAVSLFRVVFVIVGLIIVLVKILSDFLVTPLNIQIDVIHIGSKIVNELTADDEKKRKTTKTKHYLPCKTRGR